MHNSLNSALMPIEYIIDGVALLDLRYRTVSAKAFNSLSEMEIVLVEMK